MTTNPKRQYFNNLAPQWDTFPTIPNAPARIREYLKRSARPGARRILDVGCGTGILLPYFFEIYPQAASIVEFDFANAMLVENARKFRRECVSYVCGDARNLPFRQSSFDIVLCFSVLPHLGDAAAVIRGLFQVLRPQGALSVGHMSASKELNEFHSSMDGPIKHDRLLPAHDLGEILRGLGATVNCTDEQADSYFVRAEKRGE
jgi:ubiquinone/menaquinone biosynthesis C-methylase UbiE